MLNFDIIVEARMNSSRLPGKMMLTFDGVSALEVLIGRLKNVTNIRNIIIATTDTFFDDIIYEISKSSNIQCYRGSEFDVLKRVCEAANKFNTDVIVQVTGDTIFVDPVIVENMVSEFDKKYPKIDILVNDWNNSIPLGFSVRIFKTDLLKKVEIKQKDCFYRENVEAYFYNNKQEFSFEEFRLAEDFRCSDIRLTLDTLEDYVLMAKVYKDLKELAGNFSLEDVLQYFDRNKHLKKINNEVKQNKILLNAL